MAVLKITEVDLRNKRVLIREDFNVPLENGTITSEARIKAALPTIKYALDAGAAVILLSHLGRPEEGVIQAEFSLKPVAAALEKYLHKPVKFIQQWLEGIDIQPGEIVLCENVRFVKGEKKNDMQLAQKMAQLCDVFVMDAFATAHRAEASTEGVARYAKIACAGLLLTAELAALEKALENPAKPLLAIIGGSKVSTKLSVLENLIAKVDYLIVGGGIANTFLAAQGCTVGKSLHEAELMAQAKRLEQLAHQKNVQILLPVDVMVAKQFTATAQATHKSLDKLNADEMILDIGPETTKRYVAVIQKAKTILWNGPVGVFEFPAFAQGTAMLAHAIAQSQAFSIAGGGDTLAAIEKYGVTDKISYISTGGGAFLEYVEGKQLPAVKVLQIGTTS